MWEKTHQKGRLFIMRSLLLIGITLSMVLFAAACGEVTYPKETLRESVIKLCKDEYNLDVDVSFVGNTLVIYLPLPNLFDITFHINKDCWEKISNILLNARRVALSTDADIKFYCVITQDVRLPEIQLVIVNYVEDIKRVLYWHISRDEYFKRTLKDLNENPQARKEKTITDVFNKMDLDKEWQEKVLNDFFRSPPSSLEGMGYWNGQFYIKDITLPEFLAQQIANRVKGRFWEKDNLKKYGIKSVTGKFAGEYKPAFFLIGFDTEGLLFVLDPEKKMSMEREIFANIFEEAADVIYGYKFRDFNLLEIVEKSSNTKLLVPREDVYLFKEKKLPIDAILKTMQ